MDLHALFLGSTLAATWLMAMQALHAGSQRESGTDRSWEEVKLLGWGVRPLSIHLWAPKDYAMEQELWTLAFVLALLRVVGLLPWQKEEMGVDTGVPYSPRSRST